MPAEVGAAALWRALFFFERKAAYEIEYGFVGSEQHGVTECETLS